MMGEAVSPDRPRALPSNHPDEPFVGLEHIEPHTTRLLGCVPAETMRSSGVRFSPGDVLYGRMRPYLNKVWLADRSGLCSGEFIVFPGAGAFQGGFLKYRLNAQDFVAFADHTTTGDRPRADFLDLRRFPILLPPLAEQARIADRIDELFTDLAAAVAALERVRRNLKRYRSAVLHAAVMGRLVGQTNAEWVKHSNWQSLGDVIQDLEQGWSPKCDREPAPTDEEWAVMTTTAIQPVSFNGSANKKLPAPLKPRPELEIKPGDVLITRAGPRSRAGVACLVKSTRPKLILCDKAYRFRCQAKVATGEYIELVLNARPITDAIDAMKTGISDSGVNLTQGRFRQLAIPLPPVSVQIAIVAAVQEKLSQIDSLEAEVDRGLARASRLRQSILKVAFEGQLVAQDPNDEPASVLLARLKSEAAASSATRETNANLRATAPKRRSRKSRALANSVAPTLFSDLHQEDAPIRPRRRKKQ
jgi:type I restriction enzyme S subunit